MSRTRRPRAFRRDESLSIRLPAEDKDRLVRLAEINRRDTSNLALEFLVKGMLDLESRGRRDAANGVRT